MKIRPQRGSLTDAMAEMEEIEPTREAIADYLYRKWELQAPLPLNPDLIEVVPYGYDERIDWDTHLVVLGGAAVGFTDGGLINKVT